MKTFYINNPVGTGKKASLTIADLIPIGRDNAIKRADLVKACVQHKLIESGTQEDRAMRKLLEKARHDYTILNLSDGNGYYRVSSKDLQDLQRYIKQEDNRAKASFRNHALAKKLYEDYIHGRMNEEVTNE